MIANRFQRFVVFGLVAGALSVPSASASTADAATEGAEPGKWTQDYDAAVEAAKELRLPVLLKFTGSDWCGWCKLMEANVFSDPEFSDWADGRVFLVTIDHPRDESLVPPAFRERNQALFARYGVSGVPRYVVQDPDGNQLGSLGASQGATVENFTQRFERIAGDAMPGKDAVPAARPSGKPADPLPDFSVALAYAARDPSCKPLENLSAALVAAVGKKKEEMEKKEENLRSGMKAALERAKANAQAKGDLDGVLLFEEAAKDPDATPKTDNETLLGIFKTRDQTKESYRAAFKQDCARILSSAVSQLAKMKAEETKKGNIVLAKEVADFEKTVQEILEKLQKEPGNGKPGAGRTGDRPGTDRPETERPGGGAGGPPDVGGTSRNITVQVDRENGAALGRFEQGEVIIVQYLSGTYKPWRGDNETVNPDIARSYYYSGEGSPVLEGPLNNADRRTYTLPKGTSKRPFAFAVTDAGHFALKCYSGKYSEGRLSYRVTKLNVLEAKELEKSGKKSAFQWP